MISRLYLASHLKQVENRPTQKQFLWKGTRELIFQVVDYLEHEVFPGWAIWADYDCIMAIKPSFKIRTPQ